MDNAAINVKKERGGGRMYTCVCVTYLDLLSAVDSDEGTGELRENWEGKSITFHCMPFFFFIRFLIKRSQILLWMIESYTPTVKQGKNKRGIYHITWKKSQKENIKREMQSVFLLLWDSSLFFCFFFHTHTLYFIFKRDK